MVTRERAADFSTHENGAARGDHTHTGARSDDTNAGARRDHGGTGAGAGSTANAADATGFGFARLDAESYGNGRSGNRRKKQRTHDILTVDETAATDTSPGLRRDPFRALT